MKIKFIFAVLFNFLIINQAIAMSDDQYISHLLDIFGANKELQDKGELSQIVDSKLVLDLKNHITEIINSNNFDLSSLSIETLEMLKGFLINNSFTIKNVNVSNHDDINKLSKGWLCNNGKNSKICKKIVSSNNLQEISNDSMIFSLEDQINTCPHLFIICEMDRSEKIGYFKLSILDPQVPLTINLINGNDIKNLFVEKKEWNMGFRFFLNFYIDKSQSHLVLTFALDNIFYEIVFDLKNILKIERLIQKKRSYEKNNIKKIFNKETCDYLEKIYQYPEHFSLSDLIFLKKYIYDKDQQQHYEKCHCPVCCKTEHINELIKAKRREAIKMSAQYMYVLARIKRENTSEFEGSKLEDSETEISPQIEEVKKREVYPQLINTWANMKFKLNDRKHKNSSEQITNNDSIVKTQCHIL